VIHDLVIKKLDAAKQLLAEAKTIQDAKKIVDMAQAAEIYAKRQRLGEDAIGYAHDIKLEALRLLGTMLQATKRAKPAVGSKIIGSKRVPMKDPTPTLADLGLDKKTSMLARRVANLSPEKFKDVQASVVTLAKMTQPPKGTLGTGDNEWYTPTEYLDAARIVLKTIDLDPASSEQANRTVQATRFYSQQENGLLHPWFGTVWLNPPYAQPLIGQFIEKLLEELTAKRTTAALVLTHNYTDTAWFHRAASHANALCFTRGRIAFLDPDGKPAAPTQGQAFHYFGPHVDRFATQFAPHGLILVPR